MYRFGRYFNCTCIVGCDVYYKSDVVNVCVIVCFVVSSVPYNSVLSAFLLSAVCLSVISADIFCCNSLSPVCLFFVSSLIFFATYCQHFLSLFFGCDFVRQPYISVGALRYFCVQFVGQCVVVGLNCREIIADNFPPIL